jgi:hypothetical protein
MAAIRATERNNNRNTGELKRVLSFHSKNLKLSNKNSKDPHMNPERATESQDRTHEMKTDRPPPQEEGGFIKGSAAGEAGRRNA